MFQYNDIKHLDIFPNNSGFMFPEKILFDKVSNVKNAKSNSICWIKKGVPNIMETISEINHCFVILHAENLQTLVQNANTNQNSYYICDDPKFIFSYVVNYLFVQKIEYNIHSTAILHPEANISEKVYIGPFTEVGKCHIGEGTIIHGHCKIHDNTIIGKNVIINSFVNVGGDGFGYTSNTEKQAIKFPHIGGVILEDGVEIGSNTCIDKGALGNTIIKRNVKIDNLVHIAHNVEIGENTFVIARAMIGGSVIIGKNCWVAPSASIINGVQIGDQVVIGIGAVVTKSIPEGEVWAGSPAKPTQEIKDYNQKIKRLLENNE